jgi:hypothetical protein
MRTASDDIRAYDEYCDSLNPGNETAIEALTAEATMPIGHYQPRVEAALAAVDGWTVRDFIDLAIAAADQAGASVRDQERIAEILNARSAA